MGNDTTGCIIYVIKEDLESLTIEITSTAVNTKFEYLYWLMEVDYKKLKAMLIRQCPDPFSRCDHTSWFKTPGIAENL